MNNETGLTSEFEKIKRREIASKRLSIIIGLTPFVFGLVWLYFTNSQVQKLNDQIGFKKDTLRQSQHALYSVNHALDSVRNIYTKFMVALSNISSDSLSNPDNRDRVITTSIQANDQLNKISKNYFPDKNIVINYYFKTVDDQKIKDSLKSLGFNFAQKNAALKMQTTKTNAIWYGSKVSINDGKLVALTLIRAGVELKAIRPFKANAIDTHYKENVIEIGGDALLDYQNKKPLSVDYIVNTNSFDRD